LTVVSLMWSSCPISVFERPFAIRRRISRSRSVSELPRLRTWSWSHSDLAWDWQARDWLADAGAKDELEAQASAG
jgi:hypothetical protein